VYGSHSAIHLCLTTVLRYYVNAEAAAASDVVVDVVVVAVNDDNDDDDDDDDDDDNDDEGGITSWNDVSLPGKDALTSMLFLNSFITSGGVAEPAVEGVEAAVDVVAGADEEGVVIAVPAVTVCCCCCCC
jgi:hypothetical protein